MTNIAIRVQNLGKQYRIGGRRQTHKNYGRLSEALVGAFTAPLRRLRGVGGTPPETFWALQDVGFEVKPGEVVGIIGRNGAGKSTLLKILSRITQPTTGRVEIYGRVGSLLEVGTGFHPELTGRENIYLNGAILGMKRSEIQRKFDEIVAFAEIEKFLDTPAKRYSSGMYMRLAFAVAAHLEPEILVVDEVLAVGDASFQKKCLNKMQDVSEQQGRTVFFVSHNMHAVTRLCPRTILLDEGHVLKDGPSHEVVSVYLQSGLNTSAERVWTDISRSPGNDIVRLRSVRVKNEEGRVSEAMNIRKPVRVEMEYEVLESGHVLVPNFHFVNEAGISVFYAIENDPEWRRRPRPTGHYISTVWIPGDLLAEGTMIADAAITTLAPLTTHFFEASVVAFQVIDSLDGNSARGDFAGSILGVVRPMFRWTNQLISVEQTYNE